MRLWFMNMNNVYILFCLRNKNMQQGVKYIKYLYSRYFKRNWIEVRYTKKGRKGRGGRTSREKEISNKIGKIAMKK